MRTSANSSWSAAAFCIAVAFLCLLALALPPSSLPRLVTVQAFRPVAILSSNPAQPIRHHDSLYFQPPQPHKQQQQRPTARHESHLRQRRPYLNSTTSVYNYNYNYNNNNNNNNNINRFRTRKYMYLAEETNDDSLVFDIVQLEHDEDSIYEAARFLVDAFWLDARHLVPTQPAFDVNDNNNNNNNNNNMNNNNNNNNNNLTPIIKVSERARRLLHETQAVDLVERYGERMGNNRLLENAILMALDRKTGDIIGLVCVSALLFDTLTQELLLHEDSETLLKSAVASLAPKDRRRFKDASAEEIASNLFEGEMVAVCCISNLAVSPEARRNGIAAKLCDEAERLASVEWGYDAMLLKVEADNFAARNLYENKLRYRSLCSEAAAVAFRVDAEDGRFVESEADTLILAKDI